MTVPPPWDALMRQQQIETARRYILQADQRRALIEHLIAGHDAEDSDHPWPDLSKLRWHHRNAHLGDDTGAANGHLHDRDEPWELPWERRAS